MRSTHNGASRRLAPRARGLAAAAAAIPLLVGLAACSSGTTNAGGGSNGGSTGAASAPSAECGTLPEIAPNDPNGVVAGLPAEVQALFNGNPYKAQATNWADWKANGPIKVAYVTLPMLNAWSVGAKATLEQQFAEAKAKGLVTGDLIEEIMSDPANMTAQEQIALYQDAVNKGAQLIFMVPFDPNAIAPSIDAAAAKGIPTVTINGYVDDANAVNTSVNPYLDSGAPIAKILGYMGGKGNALIVRGVQGIATDTNGYNAIQQVLANCPDVKVVGSVDGGFNPPAANAAVTQYLAANPGQIDAVFQVGTMAQGVYQAWFASGRTPIAYVNNTGATAGSLAGWAQAIQQQPGYQTAGTGGTGTSQAQLAWEVGMRMAAGEGVKVNNISYESPVLTNDNFRQWLPSGADLNSPDETLNPEPLISTQLLDGYFSSPGLYQAK